MEEYEMGCNIPDSVRNKADQCPYNFKCLESGIPNCYGLKDFGKSVIMISPSSQINLDCPYLEHLTTMNFCFCPVHAYLITGCA